VGNFCQNSGQCCSGVCQGKKGMKKCQAHHQDICQSGDDACLDTLVLCTTSSESDGECLHTTGNAGYCSNEEGDCFACTRDTDCVPFCGEGAAGIICDTQCNEPGQTGTACLATAGNSCKIP
jgi:hypothetical protein